MAIDKRQFTLRLQDETYEKTRFLAYIDRRSIAMEIEHMLSEYIATYIATYEAKHGPIEIPEEE